jgi:hypothetical protein
MKGIPIIYILLCCFFINFSELCAQCVAGNCENGRGTFIFKSGAKYVGEFHDGEIHGVGICTYADGSKYAGQWSHRFPQGRGTKTYSDGTRRIGAWLKGEPIDEHGALDHTLASRGNDDPTDIQVGCLHGDCDNGEGTFAYPDGSRYEGEFLNGQPDGIGTWFFPNEDRYVGGFKNGLQEGKGTITYANGTIEQGTWHEGELLSKQTVAAPKLQYGCISGNCIDGQGVYRYKIAQSKYEGTFKNEMPDGMGKCTFGSGDYYEGEWKEGVFHGTGTLYKTDGEQINGNWNLGEYMGNDAETEKTPTPRTYKTYSRVQPKIWAVVIGISSYIHMPALRFTDDDAYRFYAFLKSPQGGGIPDEQIKILIDEEATRKRILETLRDVFGRADTNDLVMLYYSGHGLKGAFVPIDFDGYNNKIFHTEINQLLEKSAAKYKLCIADACHSGGFVGAKGTIPQSEIMNYYYKSLAQSESGTALILSSKSEENSLESSGLRQGVFSHFLIRGLKGEADSDRNNVVTIQELFEFIYGKVRGYTALRQSPVLKGDFDPYMTVAISRR